MISGVPVRCDYIGCESEAIYFICDMGLKFCGRHYCEWSRKNITHRATQDKGNAATEAASVAGQSQQPQGEICPDCDNGKKYYAYGTREGVVCKRCNGTGKLSPVR